jgi:acyl dehydratase
VEWVVDEQAHAAFVELSGDRNPLHVDPVAARRLPFGRVAVHGMHLVLDTLDRIGAETSLAPRRVRATFRHPVGVGDPLTTTIELDGDRAHARVMVDVWTAADIDVELGAPALSGTAEQRSVREVFGDVFGDEPEVHDIETLAGVAGSIIVRTADAGRFAAVSPHVTAELLALTRLVGMHVPGLRSVLSSIDLTIGSGSAEALQYRVVKLDWRFSQVVLEVSGGAVTGTLTAFVRPQPVQPSLGDVRPRSGEFAGQRWLVVGGSRGLGATAVLLLDAGGAEVIFTYHQGVADADALAARTTGAGALRLDLEQEADEAIGELAAWRPTHLAYMASPPIFVGAAGTYSNALFERFRAFYVDRFIDVIAALDGAALRGVLWPSSQVIEHPTPGTAEYADAKRVGEQACRDLAAARPHLIVANPRFGRLLTDQTTSYVPVEFGDAPTEVLHALRAVTRPRGR